MREHIVDQLAEELAYPAFNPAFVPIEIDQDTVEISIGPWSGPGYTIHDDERDGVVAQLLTRVDGETHVEELLEPLDDEGRAEFGQLFRKLATDALIYDTAERDPGSWTHLALRDRFSDLDRNRLESRKVLVIGSGEMRKQVATDLSSVGVQEIGIIDPTSETPVDGQLDENIVEFETDSLEESVAAADFVVYTASRPYPNLEDRINDATQEHGPPWTSVRIHGFDGFVGPTIFPGETACFNCYREREMANISDPSRYQSYLQQMADQPDATQLRLPGLGRMLAGYLVMDLVNLLAFGTGFTSGRVFVVNGTRLSIDCNDVLKLPRCQSCGKQRGDTVSRFGGESQLLEAAERFEIGDGR